MLTARAMTRASVASEIRDCPSMVSLAHRDSGMTSVGLKAVALVNEKVKVIDELRFPLGVGEVGVLHLHELEVGQGTPGVGAGGRTVQAVGRPHGRGPCREG